MASTAPEYMTMFNLLSHPQHEMKLLSTALQQAEREQRTYLVAQLRKRLLEMQEREGTHRLPAIG